MRKTLPGRRQAIVLLATGLILLIPFIVMQFSDELHWTAFDFAVAAALLLGTGLLGEYLLRNLHSRGARIAAGLALLAALLLAWAELAVGIFGSPIAGS